MIILNNNYNKAKDTQREMGSIEEKIDLESNEEILFSTSQDTCILEGKFFIKILF